jgi:hypothetical protein
VSLRPTARERDDHDLRGGVSELGVHVSENKPSVAAVGLTVFASIMLILIGIVQALAGLTAVINDDVSFWVTGEEANYWVTLDRSGWGWIHLILGIVIFLAGLGVLSGKIWARTVGVAIAAASAVVNFMFIPVYPFWALVIITLNVFVIWALTVRGGDINRAT